MAHGYVHDIFISYRHAGPAHTWVTEYFFPLLKDWLPEHMPPDYQISENSIFTDTQVETGTSWPIRLVEALRTSRCLLPIWSPQYFRSKWCMAELHTMLEREKILGMRKGHNWSGIIYPVIFKSACLIPPEYRTIQYEDLSHWGINASSFKDSSEYLHLESGVQKICEKLRPMILGAPDWQDTWPTVTPEALPSNAFPLPRFL